MRDAGYVCVNIDDARKPDDARQHQTEFLT
jgi:hypothetical protein